MRSDGISVAHAGRSLSNKMSRSLHLSNGYHEIRLRSSLSRMMHRDLHAFCYHQGGASPSALNEQGKFAGIFTHILEQSSAESFCNMCESSKMQSE